VVQFSGGSVTFCGGLLFFSRARAREGFGDISGILAVFGGGRAAADDFAIFEKGLFLRGSKRFRYHYMQEVVPCCAIFAKLQNSLIQPRTSQSKSAHFQRASRVENGRLSYVDFVSFLEIQSNFALQRGGGIYGSAHMRKTRFAR